MRYGFRRRLALLLCIALTVHPAEVFAARSLAGNTEEVTEQTTDVVNNAAYSQASDGISTLEREQLREKIGAEGIENIYPDAAADDAVEAELSEKAAYDAELDSYKVDDSSKLDDAHVGGNNADDYQDEKDPAGIERDGIGEPASNKFDFTIGGTQYNDSLDVAVSKAAQEGKPVYFNTNSQIDVNKTIEIPSGKRVELHSNGVSVQGLNIGQNPIFSVSDKATLRIYGMDNASTSAKITGGRNGAIIAGDESTVELSNMNLYNNRSGENGGALYSDASNFSLCSFRFEGNKSKFDGGAVYFNGSGNGLANCEIEKNSARYGGGVYVDRRLLWNMNDNVILGQDSLSPKGQTNLT